MESVGFLSCSKLCRLFSVQSGHFVCVSEAKRLGTWVSEQRWPDGFDLS